MIMIGALYWLRFTYVFEAPILIPVTRSRYEGSVHEVTNQKAQVTAIAKKHGGVSGGAEGGRTGYNVTMAIGAATTPTPPHTQPHTRAHYHTCACHCPAACVRAYTLCPCVWVFLVGAAWLMMTASLSVI
eukprot:COSAG01_NODE_744_length_13876_cov_4.660449_10_plen_130_part_00